MSHSQRFCRLVTVEPGPGAPYVCGRRAWYTPIAHLPVCTWPESGYIIYFVVDVNYLTSSFISMAESLIVLHMLSWCVLGPFAWGGACGKAKSVVTFYV